MVQRLVGGVLASQGEESHARRVSEARKTEYRFKRVTAAMSAQKPEMMSREPRHRPHGATWINGQRWQDELEQPTQLTESAAADDCPESKVRMVTRYITNRTA
jgi:hypothetical protein